MDIADTPVGVRSGGPHVRGFALLAKKVLVVVQGRLQEFLAKVVQPLLLEHGVPADPSQIVIDRVRAVSKFWRARSRSRWV